MAKSSTRLRFLLSLGNTKMVVLDNEDDLHIYSNYTSKSADQRTIAAEHVTEALVK